MKLLAAILIVTASAWAQMPLGGITGSSGGGGAGTYSFVKSQSTKCNVNAGATTSCTVVFASNVAAGHLVWVPYGIFPSATISASDTSGSTWTCPAAHNQSGSCWAIAAGTFTTITLTFPSSTAIVGLADEFSRSPSGVALDTSNTTTTGGASTTATTASLTPAGSNELFLATNVANNVPTETVATSGWTNVASASVGSNFGSIGAAYLISADSLAHSCSWTLGSSQTWANSIFAFK